MKVTKLIVRLLFIAVLVAAIFANGEDKTHLLLWSVLLNTLLTDTKEEDA